MLKYPKISGSWGFNFDESSAWNSPRDRLDLGQDALQELLGGIQGRLKMSKTQTCRFCFRNKLFFSTFETLTRVYPRVNVDVNIAYDYEDGKLAGKLWRRGFRMSGFFSKKSVVLTWSPHPGRCSTLTIVMIMIMIMIMIIIIIIIITIIITSSHHHIMIIITLKFAATSEQYVD